jgi:FlaA1/EpsC-like NDP-sugar epimerase
MTTKFKNLIKQFGRKILSDRHISRWLILMADLFVVIASYIFIYLIINNFSLSVSNFSMLIFGADICFYLIMFYLFRTYSSFLRHTSIYDITKIITSTTLSLIVILLFLSIYSFALKIPVEIIYYKIVLFQYFIINSILISFRLFVEGVYKISTDDEKKNRRVLIFGAGSFGFLLLRAFIADSNSRYNIVGFIDDNSTLQGKILNGINVYPFKKIDEKFVAENNIFAIILAIRNKNIADERRLEIIKKSSEIGLEVLELPTVDSWINAGMDVRQIRKVSLEDLLGREPINLDLNRINEGIRNKTILVTGAAGSIGSEIVRILVTLDVKRLILLDQAESGLFDLQHEILEKKNGHLPGIEIVIGDVSNWSFLKRVFQEFSPNIVFNAAAYKHVPICESQPHEAIRVNVRGTVNLADLSIEFNVEKFVMISTDKAVNPTNVMGSTKRVGEIYIQALSMNKAIKTQFITTRFGNVLGSNGSVVKTFKRQIEKGGPVTITHPDITRYFMTIPEASQLVIEAGFLGNGGEIFVFDMGQPHKISHLAKEMIKQYGYEPEKDINLVYTGLRPGEKLYEELLTNTEEILPTHNKKIFISSVSPIDSTESIKKVKDLIENLYEKTAMEIVAEIKVIVPEYISNNSIFCELDEPNINK